MLMHPSILPSVLSLVLLVGTITAGESSAPAGPPFADGEVVALVGDSITHNGLWHRYVADFYATRYPSRTVRFINGGISGDTTGGVLDRLDDDILIHHPTSAVVMLGMNDVGRNDYKHGLDADPAALARRNASLEGYQKNQRILESRLRAGGVRHLVLMTPTPFDQTARLERENLPGVDDALGRCAAIVTDLAAKGGHGLVDLHAPMSALNAGRQAADPAFTLIGSDRVHPGPPGHLVMAWKILTAQGVEGTVSRIRVDAASRTVGSCQGATLSDTAWNADGVTTTVEEAALPWPIDAGARPALAWAPISQELNRQEFVCGGLPAGSYSLRIDDVVVGTWSAAELASGVNLAPIATTPQAQQAATVQALCEERRSINVALRSIPFVERKWFRGKSIDLNDPVAVDRGIEEFIAKGGPTAAFYRTVAEKYRATKPKAAASWSRISVLADAIKAAAQPKPHRYVLRRSG